MTKLAVLVSVMAVSSAAGATTYEVSAGSEVKLLAHITGGSFTATNKTVSGTVITDESHTVTEGAIVLKAAAFETGIGMRDTHMREKYLEADKCPQITLDLKGAKLTAGGAGELDVDGTMTAHCVTKPVKLHVKVVEDNGTLLANATFPIDITDYGIPQPKLAVVKMDPKVDVTVNVRFAK